MRVVSKILLTFGVSYLTVLYRNSLKYARLLTRYLNNPKTRLKVYSSIGYAKPMKI
jgi:hypothetical protein